MGTIFLALLACTVKRELRAGTRVIGQDLVDLLEAGLQFVDEIDALIRVAIVSDGRGSVSEAGHLEELVVVVGIARAGETFVAE